MAKNGKVQDYAYLEQLSTEELEELLCADVDSPDSSNNIILHILEVIEKREKEHPTGRLPDVNKSWENFKKYYNTPEGDGLSLYPSEYQNDSTTAVREVIPFTPTLKRLRLRRIIITVAAMICLAALTIPQALGHGNIFQIIAHWTAEQFNFNGTSESTDSHEQTQGKYSSLQDALTQYGIDDAVVPKSIPDGFHLQEIWIQEYAGKGEVDFTAPYVRGNDNIIITVIQHNGEIGNSHEFYEKNSGTAEQYMSGNIEHYIFRNNNNITVAWYVNSLECSISTTLSVEELEKIIDSIYKE